MIEYSVLIDFHLVSSREKNDMQMRLIGNKPFCINEHIPEKYVPDVTSDRRCIIHNNPKSLKLLCLDQTGYRQLRHSHPNSKFQHQFGTQNIFFLNKTHAVNLTELRKSKSGLEQKSIIPIDSIPGYLMNKRIIKNIKSECFVCFRLYF